MAARSFSLLLVAIVVAMATAFVPCSVVTRSSGERTLSSEEDVISLSMGVDPIAMNSSTTHHFYVFLLRPFAPSTAIPASSTALPVKIKVVVGEGEPIESALRRFKREVNKSGHLMELRHKRYFENSQDRKKRKIVQARIRKRLERMQARRLRQQRS
ncbi:hypothetical protein HJC23_013252 [Cyclotella cryptica]|uniref:30S ribosomal protein S21 n=1 Tax=Cyclotella cryptica TaxID=29204 RepID=A0ABD3PGP6_9STRA